MPDIFDQVAAKPPKQDIFDQVATNMASEKSMAANPPVQPMPQVNMQGSSLPGIVRGAADTLPVAGGIAGGAAGAASGALTIPVGGVGIPAGGVAGGALGTAAGMQLKQGILNKAFGEGPAPTSKQGLKDTATGAVIGGASELPGALLSGYGNLMLKRLGSASSAGQVGDAVRALQSGTSIKTLTQDGLLDGLEGARTKLSADLTRTLGSAQGTIDLDATLSPIRSRAALEDVPFIRGKNVIPGNGRVSNMVSDAIAAAKSEAGITGSTATAQQAANFQRAVQRQAFKASKVLGPGSVAQDVLTDAYKAAGSGVRSLAPDTDEILSKMADIHAAKSALKNYPLGATRALAVNAAVHPAATAIASPALTGVVATEGKKGIDTLRELRDALSLR